MGYRDIRPKCRYCGHYVENFGEICDGCRHPLVTKQGECTACGRMESEGHEFDCPVELGL